MRFRRHPSERALRRWGQLSPELRELVARAARSVAKDAVQEVMETQGLIYRTQALSALETIEQAASTLTADAEQRDNLGHSVLTDDEVTRAERAIMNAYRLVDGERPRMRVHLVVSERRPMADIENGELAVIYHRSCELEISKDMQLIEVPLRAVYPERPNASLLSTITVSLQQAGGE